MTGILTAFAVVGLAIFVGYLLGRTRLLGPHANHVLGRLTFFVLSPFLLFVVLAQADVTNLFSTLLPVSALAALSVMVPFVLIARLLWRRSLGELVIGALSAGQVNSNNIGIPFSLYLLGSAAFPAPVIFMQLLILTPVSLTLLDAAASGSRSFGRILLQTARNPMLIAAALGVGVSLLGIELPHLVLDPLQLIADACVPVLLMNYGMSLSGQRVLTEPAARKEVLLATLLKLVVMPLSAWLIGRFAFGLDGIELAAVVVLAALPTAQNVFNFSQQYGVGGIVSRDTIFLTTIGCAPVLLLVSLVLS